MRLSTAAINRMVETYLRDLAALLPQAAPMDPDAKGATGGRSGDRMARLLQLARHGELLRYCSDLQCRLLILSVGGRAFRAKNQRVRFVDVPTEGEVRPMTVKEIAKHEGITVSRYEREMTKAREAVSHAASDMLERRSEREAA